MENQGRKVLAISEKGTLVGKTDKVVTKMDNLAEFLTIPSYEHLG